jgi:hypothetical protein
MRINSSRLINLIKDNFINEDGVLSLDFPVSKKNLLSDLDDYLPFFLYFGEKNFIKNQIMLSRKIYKKPSLVQSRGSRIISYMNNEYVGGIANYYQLYKETEIKSILDNVIKSVFKNLTNGNHIISYYDRRKKKKSSLINPYFGGFIEVLIELEYLYPKLKNVIYPTIDIFLSDPTFIEKGIFVSKIHPKSKFYNYLFKGMILPLPNKVLNILNVHFYSLGRWSDYLFCLPIGPFSQLAKDNSNLVYALIEAYKKTKDDKYKEAVKKWIFSFEKYFMRGNNVYRFLNRNYSVNEINTGHIHPVIDILCDTYVFVSKDQKYIDLAFRIMDKVISNYKWDNGLIPTIPNKNFNSLDIQTDFIVSLWRISEISGNDKYKKISYNIYESIIKYHFSDFGLNNSVDINGNQIGKVEPKYNALFLKAMILMEQDNFKIYKNSYNHGLMKDR